MTEAAFPWYGGKRQLADRIIEMMPPHTRYVEVFGGSAAVLCAKSKSELEVYNDKHGGLVNFFRVLRDKPKQLQRALKLTPYARDELEKYVQPDRVTDVERARRFYVCVYQAWGGQEDAAWSYNIDKCVKANAFVNAVDRLHTVAERLRTVQVENLDWHVLVERYDRPGTMFYADPPYVFGTRSASDYYYNEMTDDDHRDFVKMFCELQGDAIISGYEHELYEPLVEAGYELHRVEVSTRLTSRSAVARTECLWRRVQSSTDTLFPLYAIDVAPTTYSKE